VNQNQAELIALARMAQERAYAPYSNYRVGAALQTVSGKVYSGCNIENISYGATVCAERVAVFKAVSSGERCFTALAVVVSDDRPAYPCGICRQVLFEFAPDLVLYLRGCRGTVETALLRDLLPRAFKPALLTEDAE